MLVLYLFSLGARGGHLRAKDTSEWEMRVLSSMLSFQKQVNASMFSGKNWSVVSHWTLAWLSDVKKLWNTYSKHPHMETCWVICCCHATSDLDGFLQILQEDSTDCFWGALQKFYAAMLKNTVTGFYLRWDMVWCRAPSCVLKCCLLGNRASKGCQGNSSMLYATVQHPRLLSSCMCKNRQVGTGEPSEVLPDL